MGQYESCRVKLCNECGNTPLRNILNLKNGMRYHMNLFKDNVEGRDLFKYHESFSDSEFAKEVYVNTAVAYGSLANRNFIILKLYISIDDLLNDKLKKVPNELLMNISYFLISSLLNAHS